MDFYEHPRLWQAVSPRSGGLWRCWNIFLISESRDLAIHGHVIRWYSRHAIEKIRNVEAIFSFSQTWRMDRSADVSGLSNSLPIFKHERWSAPSCARRTLPPRPADRKYCIVQILVPIGSGPTLVGAECAMFSSKSLHGDCSRFNEPETKDCGAN